MFFKKKKTKIKNEGMRTHLILNGIDISENVTEYKITQKGGERPKLTIVCTPKKLDMLLGKVKDIKVKVEK